LISWFFWRLTSNSKTTLLISFMIDLLHNREVLCQHTKRLSY
jgi:hypothetical protein